MHLYFHRLRFHFLARVPLYVPGGSAANRVRGGLGRILKAACPPDCKATEACPVGRQCLYGHLFEPPAAAGGPSGYKDAPRPFVLRPRALEERRTEAGSILTLDIHLFDLDPARPEQLTTALAKWALDGLGPSFGSAELALAEQIGLDGSVSCVIFNGHRSFDSGPALMVPLAEQPGPPIRELTVEFLSPTELKGEEFSARSPGFGPLFGRALERVSTLARLYNGATPVVDFRGLIAAARTVSVAEASMRPLHRERVSAHTGDRHSLGGLVGRVRYTGDELRPFLPWLAAGVWTGVGRQTVWGKGEIRVLPGPEGE
jgi:hypothetical protein